MTRSMDPEAKFDVIIDIAGTSIGLCSWGPCNWATHAYMRYQETLLLPHSSSCNVNFSADQSMSEGSSTLPTCYGAIGGPPYS